MMADVPPDANRGAAGTEVRTAAALRALGHDVDNVWLPDLGRRIGHGNLHLLLELPRTYERAAVAALRRKPYDVVHVNQPHGFRAARAVHRLSPKTAFVHRSHGFELNVEETLRPWRAKFGSDERGVVRRLASAALAPLLARHSRAIARDADGHIVSSTLDAAFLQERLGVPGERVAVVPQAADDNFLTRPVAPFDEARLRRMLYVGQFAFVKAPMIAAAAMSGLARDPSLQFTWVCERRHHPDVRALLATDRVELLDWMPREELIDVYDRHGIFLFPSFFEGFGKAFVEAMSRGLCVVATDAGGMHDVIADGRNGLLVRPGDAGALTAAARTLLDDPPSAAAMSGAAVKTASAYTWDRAGRETAAFYERLSLAR